MHEKKDVWKLTALALAGAMVLSGCGQSGGKLRYIDSGFKGGDISFIRCGNIVREKTRVHWTDRHYFGE